MSHNSVNRSNRKEMILSLRCREVERRYQRHLHGLARGEHRWVVLQQAAAPGAYERVSQPNTPAYFPAEPIPGPSLRVGNAPATAVHRLSVCQRSREWTGNRKSDPRSGSVPASGPEQCPRIQKGARPVRAKSVPQEI